MRVILQSIFCVLACLSVVAAMIVGTLWGLEACLYCIAAAAIFALLMILVKNRFGKKKEQKPDFMNSDEENDRIRNENDSPEQ